MCASGPEQQKSGCRGVSGPVESRWRAGRAAKQLSRPVKSWRAGLEPTSSPVLFCYTEIRQVCCSLRLPGLRGKRLTHYASDETSGRHLGNTSRQGAKAPRTRKQGIFSVGGRDFQGFRRAAALSSRLGAFCADNPSPVVDGGYWQPKVPGVCQRLGWTALIPQNASFRGLEKG